MVSQCYFKSVQSNMQFLNELLIWSDFAKEMKIRKAFCVIDSPTAICMLVFHHITRAFSLWVYTKENVTFTHFRRKLHLKVPLDDLQFSSCFQYILKVAHEDQDQTSEVPSNHYRQSKQSPKKAELQHPGMKKALYLNQGIPKEHICRGPKNYMKIPDSI